MKNKFIYMVRMAALPLLLAATACEDTLIAPAPGIAGDGPTLTLTLDNNEEKAGTRSELTSSAPTNHVTTVRILVFQQMTDGAEPVYVGQEPQDIDWLNYNTDKKLELGERSRITYQLNYPFEKGATYTLLGVAMDENFDDDYTLDVENKTLSNAVAILKDGKTGTDIAKHEFFTGTTTFTHEGRDTHIDDLLMKRRVAGILLYVTDVPQTMPSPTDNNTNCRTTAIRLRLGEKDNVTLQQNKSVTLYRDLKDEDWTEPDTPAQQTLEDSNVLTTIDISSWTYTLNKECYVETIDGVEQIKKSAPTGLYILPLTTDGSTPTLQVDIVGKADSNGNGTPDDDATEEVLKTLTVQNMSEEGQPTAFSLRSNYIYSIGKYNPDQDIDQPISLLGEAIYLEVLPFEKVPATEHEFGEARVHALFDHSDNPIHNCMNEEFNIRILPPLTTIRENVQSITLTIVHDNTYAVDDNGKEVLIKEDATLADDRKDYFKNWLYVKTKDVPADPKQNQYGSSYTLYTKGGNTEIDKLPEVTLFIEDYARFRQWGWTNEGQWEGGDKNIERINQDIRHNTIILTTSFTEESGIDERTDTLMIKQFNTISVYYKSPNIKLDEDDQEKYTEAGSGIVKCGFSRFDLQDKTVTDNFDSYRFIWGFWGGGTTNTVVYPASAAIVRAEGSKASGARNLLDIGRYGFSADNWLDTWSGGASGKAFHSIRKVDDVSDTTGQPITQDEFPTHTTRTDKAWYLPAQIELEGLIVLSAAESSIAIVDKDKGFRLIEYQPYWTSTLGGSETSHDTYYYTYPAVRSPEKPWEGEISDRENKETLRIRQARKFSDYYTDENW